MEIINKYRGNGIHEISFDLYDKITKVLHVLLDFVYENKDFQISKYCMILSQTYYKVENSKRKYLNDAIENNKLFDNLCFWEEYISCKIKLNNLNNF